MDNLDDLNNNNCYSAVLGPFQTPCLSRAELNSLFKFDYGTAVARRLKPFKN